MKLFPRRFAIFVLIPAAVMIGTAIFQPSAGNEESQKTITVSLGGGWPPYLIVDPEQNGPKGKRQGILMDIFRRIARTLRYEVKTVCYPEKRDHVMLDKGLIDFRFDGRKWVDNPDRYFWSESILRASNVLVFRKEDPLRFNHLEDLSGKTVITHLGYTYPTLNPYFSSGRIRRSDAASQQYMLRMLDAERGDAAIMNKRVALWVMKNSRSLSSSDFTFSSPVDSSRMALLYTRPEWHGFVKDFNRELSKMKIDGRINGILSDYR